MRNRTWIAALALTGCALVAGGCKTDGTAAPSQHSGTVAATNAAKVTNPADEVVAAADKLHTTSFKFTMTTAGVTIDGSADPATKTATMDLAASMKMLMVDGQMYMKLPQGMPGAAALGGDKWIHLDPSKFSPDKLGMSDPTDPTGGFNTLKTATSVQKIDATHYKGTLDLTKAPASAANAKRLSTMGDSAKAVPFEASVDDQGRLSTMDMTMKVNGSDVTAHTTFSDFGTKVTAAKPAPSEVTEAPDSIYGVLGA